MPKIYKIIVTLLILLVTLFLPKNVLAFGISKIEWVGGRVNSIILENGQDNWGIDTGTVNIDNLPSEIISWSENYINVAVPSLVNGFVNFEITKADNNKLPGQSIWVSLKVDSFPQEITIGDDIIITGEFRNDNAEVGKVINLSVGGLSQPLPSYFLNWTNNKITIQTSEEAGKLFKIGQNTIKLFYGSLGSKTFDIQIKSNADVWQCNDWGYCLSNGIKTRICNKTYDNPSVETPSPETSKTCTPSCTIESSYFCDNWTSCSSLGKRIRACFKSYDCPYTDVPMPETEQSCTPPCTADTWSCDYWGECQNNGTQTRTCTKTFDCPTATTQSPATTQSCSYVPPCYSDTWSCGNWTTCSSDGSQTRVCNKTNDCATADTPSPMTTQNCTPPAPTCTADTWTCDSWGACSLSGIQSRNCTKTFDCPNIQTAPPITDQYCESPYKPQQITPGESEEITNQDMILKATVKLWCPATDEQSASQGSGTIIDSSGTILTNKHVVVGTLGCLVGFIDNFDDEPYFGDRQIADVVKTSFNQDIAVLKIRNPKNKALSYVNTTNGNINFALGTKITTYGYPAKFGTKVTYTSGDFSGTDGYYLKTTAILEHGNSGGGAYLKNGTYIGIPSLVRKGELNAMGYILSINTIRAWLNNSAVASGNTNNNYSRVSVLEDIDLKKLGSLKLFIPNVDKNSNLITPATNQNTQKTTDQPQVATQQESVVIESNNLNKDSTSSVQNVSSTPEQPPKISLIKRFFLWLSNLFNKLAK